MRSSTHLITFALVALIGIAASGTSAKTKTNPGLSPSEQAAREVIVSTADDVLRVLRKPETTTPERLKELEKIVYAKFDLTTMSRLVVGKKWKSFSLDQRKVYIDEFIDYLSNYYGSRLDSYTEEDVEVLGASDQARGDAKVRTRMIGGQADGVLVDYRLRPNKQGEWLVIDVTIEGISMVKNFRDQFGEVIKRDGAEGLIRALEQKNREHDERSGSMVAEGGASATATP